MTIGFNLDPNSLPARMHQAPGLIPGPQLAAFSQSTAFRPPQLPPTPGMNMPQAQQGFGIGDGISAAGSLMNAGGNSGLKQLLDFLTGGYQGNPAASAAYGSPRPAMPPIVGGGLLGGGT